MTLVVGRIHDSKITIVSDSKLSDPRAVRSTPLSGVLKIVRLHPAICLCYSGVYDFATQAIEAFKASSIDDTGNLVDLLVNIHQQSNNETDFVVASLERERPFFVKISKGTVTHSDHNFWIGDHAGFEVFQKEYLELESQLPEEQKLYTAIQSVIQDPDIATVGGFPFGVETRHSSELGRPSLHYIQRLEIIINESQTIPAGGGWTKLKLGTAAGGSYGFSYFVPKSQWAHAVAIYFSHGKFGALFCHELNLHGIVIRDVDGAGFIETCKNTYGVELSGLCMDTPTSIRRF